MGKLAIGKKQILSLVGLLVLLASLPVAIFVMKQSQETRSRAASVSNPAGFAENLSPKAGKVITPSIQGFQVSAFTAAATLSYPLEVPAGTGGLTPSLGLSYSSSSVDDSRIGVKDGDKKYEVQAGNVGLGWDLGGLGAVTRNNDGDYFLSFAGGSFKLYEDTLSPNTRPHLWHTRPESFLKISHDPTNCDRANNTEPWYVWTKEGTKFTFGDPPGRDCFPGDENGNPIANIGKANPTGGKQATAYFINNNKDAGGREWTKIAPYKWMLSKVEDTHANTIEFSYNQEMSRWPAAYGGLDDIIYYTRAIYPKEIVWSRGKMKAVFVYEDREDYKIAGFNFNEAMVEKNQRDQTVQALYSQKRLQRIEAYVNYRDSDHPNGSDHPYKKYELVYGDYSRKAFYDHPDYRIVHSLLRRVKAFGKDGQQNLTAVPDYTFSYSEDGNKTYLTEADNGFGGKVQYSYASSLVAPTFCTSGRECDGSGSFGLSRSQVTEKRFFDGSGKTAKVAYSYEFPRGKYEGFRYDGVCEWDNSRGCCSDGQGGCGLKMDVPTGVKEPEFLGYGKVTETAYGYDNQVINKAVTTFKQMREIEDVDPEKQGAQGCYQTDPLMGSAIKTEVYRADGTTLLTKTVPSYQVLSKQPGEASFTNDGGCRNDLTDLKTRVYLTRNTGAVNCQGGKCTKTENLAWDDYGNVTRAIVYGEVDSSGRESEEAKKDNRIMATEYVYDLGKYIVSKPKTTKMLDYNNKEISKTEFIYNANGDLTETKAYYDLTNNQAVSVKTDYDAFGNPVNSYDAKGNKTTTAYDAVFNLYPVSVTNAKGQMVRTEYDYTLGLPTKMTDANGATVEYTFDNFGRLLTMKEKGKDEQGNGKVMTYQYTRIDNGPGLVTTVRADQMAAVQFSNGIGQVHQVQRKDVNDRMVWLDTVYNALGQAEAQSLPYYNGSLTAGWTRTSYDVLGRPVTVTNPDGTKAVTTYLDNQWAVVSEIKNAANQTESKAISYNDGFGRMVKTEEFNPVNTLYRTTTNIYDLLGNLLETKINDVTMTSSSYDALGRRTAMTDVDLGRWTYKYDNNNNVVEQVDANGKTTKMVYDQLNRVTEKVLADGSKVTYKYDEGPSALGRLSQVVTPASQVGRAFTYDARGRVVYDRVTFTGMPTFTTQFAYDNLDRLSQITYPDNEQVTNTYYAETGQLKGVAGNDIYASQISYNAAGQVVSEKLGDNTENTYAYSPQNLRLSEIKVLGAKIQPSAPIPAVDYQFRLGYPQYDSRGNIGQIAATIGNQSLSQTFQYDALNRLIGASLGGVGDAFEGGWYTYDVFDRLTLKREGTVGNQQARFDFEYNQEAPFHGIKRARRFDGQVFTHRYDTVGNVINDSQKQMSWTVDNRLQSVTKDNKTTRFVYDDSGQRIVKTGPDGRKTVYVNNYYEVEYDASGNKVLERKYYFSNGKRVAVRVSGQSAAGSTPAPTVTSSPTPTPLESLPTEKPKSRFPISPLPR